MKNRETLMDVVARAKMSQSMGSPAQKAARERIASVEASRAEKRRANDETEDFAAEILGSRPEKKFTVEVDLDEEEDQQSLQKLELLEKSQVETRQTVDQLLEHTNEYLKKLSNAIIVLTRDVRELKEAQEAKTVCDCHRE